MRSIKLATRSATLGALLLVAACASQPPPAPIKPPPAASAGRVKIGQPYQVLGKIYYPADDPNYDQTGIASWYGPGFHALSTANGERYDMNGISAAHKTLPLPSYVEVTNLDNGRKLVVRVNDRGPYVDGRIIDLSRRAGQLLGVDGPGTAHVRVRRVYPNAATIASLAPPVVTVAAVAPATIAPKSLLPLPPPAPDTTAPQQASADAAIATVAVPTGTNAATAESPAVATPAGARFIQIAAVSDQGRASWLSGYAKQWGPTLTERTAAGLWRVRIGPYLDDESARSTLAQVRAAGYSDAQMVNSTPPRPAGH
jgi:rare lipoprotein A